MDIKKDPILDWLLEPVNPSVRYFTLVDLLDVPLDSRECAEARKAVMKTGAVPELLEKQNDDGSWDVPDRFYTAKYTGTVWSVLLLAELGADPEDSRVRKACRFLLGNSFCPDNGGFSIERSRKSGSGLSGGVIPCLTGNMIFSLNRLGFADDQRISQAIDWIVRWQRTDDADGEPPQGPVYERFEVCWGRHSCHMGVAKTLKGLVSVPKEIRSSAVLAKISELFEYFLKHHVYRKSHDLFQVSKPGWLKPGFPLMYQTDVYELLEMFAREKIHDPRLEDALGIVRYKRRQDGRWLLENSYNGKMNVMIEEKGDSSRWITLRAMKILKEYV